MQCLELENGTLAPYTRDTFGIAVKSTFGALDEKKIKIFKDPKTDTGNFKKSQKGLCYVYTDEKTGNLTYVDDLFELSEEQEKTNELKTVFKNGKMIKEQSVEEIRQLLNNNNF